MDIFFRKFIRCSEYSKYLFLQRLSYSLQEETGFDIFFFSVYSLFPAVFQILSSRHHPTFTTNFALVVLKIKPVKQFWNAKHFQMKMPRVREENTSFLIEFSRRAHDKVSRKIVCHFQSSKVYTPTHICIKWLHVHKYHCI